MYLTQSIDLDYVNRVLATSRTSAESAAVSNTPELTPVRGVVTTAQQGNEADRLTVQQLGYRLIAEVGTHSEGHVPFCLFSSFLHIWLCVITIEG